MCRSTRAGLCPSCGAASRAGWRSRAETLEAPFVGRDDELRLLKDLFHATGREQRARLVSVTGQAGIGKTRFPWELEQYLDGLVEPIWWHEGRSPAYGEGITFWALGEMVRRRAGLVETDDERTTRAKVAETIAAHVPDADERRWIEPARPADPEVRAAAEAAREILVRLRAAPFIARLDAALAGPSDRAGHPAAPTTASVTPS